MTTYHKPTELLDDLDSHGIYNAKMLDDCEFDTDSVPTFTIEETSERIRARGLGGQVEGYPEDRLIYGWTTATALAKVFCGDAPGLQFQGRGSSFRADLEALREAGH